MPEGSVKTQDFSKSLFSQKFDGNVDVVTWAQAR
jgi:hypothetical protein